MKAFFFVLALLVNPVVTGGIYDFSLVSIGGTTIPLSQYAGKRLLIVVLPSDRTATDSADLGKLAALTAKYKTQLTVLGVPSYEGGYTDGQLPSLKKFYSDVLGSQVVLTQAVYTNKGSGSRQHGLFAWLTDKGRNGHFDMDVKGAGQKFLINGKGELSGVFDPGIGLNDRLIQRFIDQP
jgi:glutathione peroxidase